MIMVKKRKRKGEEKIMKELQLNYFTNSQYTQYNKTTLKRKYHECPSVRVYLCPSVCSFVTWVGVEVHGVQSNVSSRSLNHKCKQRKP